MTAPSSNQNGMFLTALNAFKQSAKLSDEELSELGSTSLDQLKLTIAKIQEEQDKTKRLLYMRRLQPFLITMEYYGKCIDTFVETSEVLAFVWVSRRHSEGSLRPG